MNQIQSLEEPKKIKLSIPSKIASQRTEIKRMLEKPVFLFAHIPQKGISLVGNSGCCEYQRVLTKYIVEN